MNHPVPPRRREVWTSVSPARRTVLVVGLPLVALLCLAGAVNVSVYLRVVDPVDISYDLAAGARVAIDISRAQLTVRASQDGRVHVSGHGSYVGAKPTLAADTSGGLTAITESGCATGWFERCWLDVTVALPAPLPLRVHSGIGSISASGLSGPLDLVTTFGDIDTTGTRGRLDLRSIGGTVRAFAVTSDQVRIATRSGDVELTFLRPPNSVRATTAHGNVGVGVPVQGVSYRVDVRAAHGRTDTASVPSDPRSRRTITVQATDGNATVVPS
jgi:hypothetical protein